MIKVVLIAIPLLIASPACTPLEVTAAEDLIQGECSLVEQVMKDLTSFQPNPSSVQSRPQVVPVKRF